LGAVSTKFVDVAFSVFTNIFIVDDDDMTYNVFQ